MIRIGLQDLRIGALFLFFIRNTVRSCFYTLLQNFHLFRIVCLSECFDFFQFVCLFWIFVCLFIYLFLFYVFDYYCIDCLRMCLGTDIFAQTRFESMDKRRELFFGVNLYNSRDKGNA